MILSLVLIFSPQCAYSSWTTRAQHHGSNGHPHADTDPQIGLSSPFLWAGCLPVTSHSKAEKSSFSNWVISVVTLLFLYSTSWWMAPSKSEPCRHRAPTAFLFTPIQLVTRSQQFYLYDMSQICPFLLFLPPFPQFKLQTSVSWLKYHSSGAFYLQPFTLPLP